VALGFTGLWLWTSLRLPHRDAGWIDLLPGALVVGVGVGILQVGAAYLLGPYALAKQGTYGALGLAAALLLSLWVLGRLVVGVTRLLFCAVERALISSHAIHRRRGARP